MKKQLKPIISVLMCITLIVLFFIRINNFLISKVSYAKNADFYNYEDDYDILFLGSSHMIMGVSPMELWNDFGITSYNLATFGQRIPLDYWVLKNALAYNRPQLVVIDVYAIGRDESYLEIDISHTHEAFDSMPLSADKLRAIADILPQERHMEFMFPFSYYHSCWNEIDASFWDESIPSIEKGATLDNPAAHGYARLTQCEAPALVTATEKNQTETNGKYYLRKIIELCQENDIEVLLTAVPFVASTEKQVWINSAQDIADEYGINFYNMNVEDAYINYYTDMQDSGHLNSSGAKKTTYALAKYLTEEYDLENKKGTEIASKWNEDYAKYTSYKIEWLKKQSSLDSYLMLLSQEPYVVVFEVTDSSIVSDTKYKYLFENLGVKTDDVSTSTNCIIVDCKNGNAKIINDGDDTEYIIDAENGKRCIRLEAHSELLENAIKCNDIYLNEQRFATTTITDDTLVQITTISISSSQGEFVDSVQLTLNRTLGR